MQDRSDILEDSPVFADAGVLRQVERGYHRNLELARLAEAAQPLRLDASAVTIEIAHWTIQPEGHRSPQHLHPMLEVSWLLRGRAEYAVEAACEGDGASHEAGRCVGELRPGEALVAPPNVVHRWSAAGRRAVLFGVMLTVEPTDRRLDSLAYTAGAGAAALEYRLPPTAEAAWLLRAIGREAVLAAGGETSRGGRHAGSLAWRYVEALTATAARGIEAAAGSANGTAPALDDARRAVLQARAFITMRLATDLTASRVADHVGITPRHLNRLLKQARLPPLSGLITQTRMNHARSLLKRRDVTVKAVANMCGYADPAYFTRAFRQTTGVTPTTYMENQRGEHPR